MKTCTGGTWNQHQGIVVSWDQTKIALCPLCTSEWQVDQDQQKIKYLTEQLEKSQKTIARLDEMVEKLEGAACK